MTCGVCLSLVYTILTSFQLADLRGLCERSSAPISHIVCPGYTRVGRISSNHIVLQEQSTKYNGEAEAHASMQYAAES